MASESQKPSFCVSSCPKNEGWRAKRLVSFYFIKEVNKQLNQMVKDILVGEIQETYFDKTSFGNLHKN